MALNRVYTKPLLTHGGRLMIGLTVRNHTAFRIVLLRPSHDSAVRKHDESSAIGGVEADDDVTVAGLGALQSVNFKGVGPGGADIYQVKFEKGPLDYRIWFGPNGKIESANVRPSE